MQSHDLGDHGILVKYKILAILPLSLVMIEYQSLKKSFSKVVIGVNNTNTSSKTLWQALWVATISWFLSI